MTITTEYNNFSDLTNDIMIATATKSIEFVYIPQYKLFWSVITTAIASAIYNNIRDPTINHILFYPSP